MQLSFHYLASEAETFENTVSKYVVAGHSQNTVAPYVDHTCSTHSGLLLSPVVTGPTDCSRAHRREQQNPGGGRD